MGNIRITMLVFAGVCALGLAACGGAAAPTPPPNSVRTPAPAVTLLVELGSQAEAVGANARDTVSFKNVSGGNHNLTVKTLSGSALGNGSGTFGPGQTWGGVVIPANATNGSKYTYACSVHGFTGTITVTAVPLG